MCLLSINTFGKVRYVGQVGRLFVFTIITSITRLLVSLGALVLLDSLFSPGSIIVVTYPCHP